MIARLDNPGKRSKEMNVSYNNKSTVARLKNYLIKNVDKYDSSDLFFTATKNNISADDFYKMIDTNVKGLGRDEHKFYSFTLNPSADELQFINSDKEKLKEFVRAAMDNFNTAHSTVKESDQLVWAAIIHDQRVITEEDVKKFKSKGENSGLKAGDMKPGENTHVHVVLSARDATQKKTITVLSSKNKVSKNFQLASFQRNNQRLFQKMFHYEREKDIYSNVQQNFIAKKIDRLNDVFYKTYELSDIKKSGDKMDWSSQFSINLTNMMRELSIEKRLVLHPTIYLEKGRKYYNENLSQAKVLTNTMEDRYVIKENTNSYQSLIDDFNSLRDTIKIEADKQRANGFNIVKKSDNEQGWGFGSGFSM